MNEEQWLQFPSQALGCSGQAGGDGDSQGCPSPQPESTARMQHIIPASLHPRKSFAHQEEQPQPHRECVVRAVTSGTHESSEQSLGPKSPFPSLPPPRVALITTPEPSRKTHRGGTEQAWRAYAKHKKPHQSSLAFTNFFFFLTVYFLLEEAGAFPILRASADDRLSEV